MNIFTIDSLECLQRNVLIPNAQIIDVAHRINAVNTEEAINVIF